jgi:hypothetical protein
MPVLKVACGQDEQGTREFAQRWGWEETASDWKKVVEVCRTCPRDIVFSVECGTVEQAAKSIAHLKTFV